MIVKKYLLPTALSIITLLILFPKPLIATNRFSVINPRPVSDGGAFYAIYQSNLLEQWQWSVGTSFDYAYQPLRATLGAVKIDFMQQYFAEHFYAALGLTDWLTFSADFPIIWRYLFRNPDTLPPLSTRTGFGDAELSFKFRILDRKKMPVGFAVAPFITLPTGRDDDFLGDRGVTGGGRLLLDGTIGERVTLALNLGALFRKRFSGYGVNFNDQFLLSGGVNVKISKLVSLFGEMDAQTPFGDFFQNKNTSPLEARLGAQWYFGKNRNVILNTGAGFGINNNVGVPKYRAMASITYVSPKKKRINRAGIINQVEQNFNFPFGKTKLSGEELQKVGMVGEVLQANSWITRIMIEGNTDSVGKKSFNERLGLKRADAIKKNLIDRGVAPARMDTISYGEEKPVSTNKTPAGRAENRRVQIDVKNTK